MNKAQETINTLINNAARRLQSKDNTLTDAQARVQIRKQHPEWAELEKRVNRR